MNMQQKVGEISVTRRTRKRREEEEEEEDGGQGGSGREEDKVALEKEATGKEKVEE